MGEIRSLVLVALLQSALRFATAEKAANPLVAIEDAWKGFVGKFSTSVTTTTTIDSHTTVSMTPFDSSGSSGSSPNYLASSNLGGAWQAKSSDADPAGSAKSWGFKVSGSSGWYQEVWQWIVIDGLFAALCCGVLCSLSSCMCGGKKKKRSTKKSRTRSIADPQNEKATQMPEPQEVEAAIAPEALPLLALPPLVASTLAPSYLPAPLLAPQAYANPAVATRYATPSNVAYAAPRLTTAPATTPSNVAYAAPRLTAAPAFSTASQPYAVRAGPGQVI